MSARPQEDWLHPSLPLEAGRVAWATSVAFLCGAIGLVGGYLAVKTGYQFGAEPSVAPSVGGYPDGLAYDFAALEPVAGAKPIPAPPVRVSSARAAVAEEPGPETTGAKPAGPDDHCTVGGWPYFGTNCPSSEESGKRRRGGLTFRLKSPWCSSAFHQQIFFNCRSRT